MSSNVCVVRRGRPAGPAPRTRSARHETDLHVSVVSTTTGRNIYRQSGDGYDGWNVARLARLAHTLPVVDVALHKPGAIDINYWFEARQPTLRQRRPAREARHTRRGLGRSRHPRPGQPGHGRIAPHRQGGPRQSDPRRAVPPERLPAPAHVTWRSAVWELLRPLHADAPGPELAAAGTSKNAHRDNGCLGQPAAVLPFAADAAVPESSVRPAEAVVAEQNAAMRRGGAAQA